MQVIFIVMILWNFIKLSENVETTKSEKTLLTPKIYSSLFIRRREEHKLFVKHLLKSNYEKTYKMLDLAFNKIIEILNENNNTLNANQYNASSQDFPTDETLQNSLTLILENVCLSGEIILHFPDISERILKKLPNWKNIFNWGINFVMQFSTSLIDENTIKMLKLFRQEINESERDDDYINPYYENSKIHDNKMNKTKRKKQIKKGPKLTSTRNEL